MHPYMYDQENLKETIPKLQGTITSSVMAQQNNKGNSYVRSILQSLATIKFELGLSATLPQLLFLGNIQAGLCLGPNTFKLK